MKKNKRGQFYLIAVLIVITIFIGLITIVNSSRKTTEVNIFGIEEELKIERRNVIDYVSFQNLSEEDTKVIFTNFSKEFASKIGWGKNIVFIFGKEDSIKLVGNRISGTSIFYNVSESLVNLTDEGSFEIDLVVSINPIEIEIDGIPYYFTLYGGQNIYYLIKYNYGTEVYIING